MGDGQIELLAQLGAATVYEANGQRGAIDPAIKPLDPLSRVAGRAVTVSVEPADNWYIHLALLEAGPGDLLVIDAQGFTGAGPWGDILTLAAQRRGLAGLVIDGAVRDSRQIVESGFPVFARGISIAGTSKSRPGRLHEAVTIGGITVRPGDVLVGDADGLVHVPADNLDSATEAAEQRERKEQLMRHQILEGATTVELLALANPSTSC